MKRKLFILFLLLTMVFAVGCNKKNKNPDPTPTPVPTSTPTPTPVPVNLAKENLSKLIDNYDSMLANQPETQVDFSKGIGYDMTLDISLGKQIASLLGMSGLDTLSLSGTIDAKDAISANLGLYINSDEIVSALVFMDGDNLLFNLPKYASDFATLSWEELLASEDASLSDSLGSITSSMNPSESMALSKEITDMLRTHLASLVNCFNKVDGIEKNASIGTGDYVMTGDKHTVSANPDDVITVLKALTADMEKYYGEMNIDWTDLETAEATALFLDYYTDEKGNYAWVFHTDETPDNRIVFINTELGFCLYSQEDGVATPAMTSVKSTENSGVIYLYSNEEDLAEGELAEPTGTIDYEYAENSVHADVVIDTIEATVDYSMANDVMTYDITLVMDGMSFVIKEKASKEHVEMSMTLASYGIEYATINIDMTLRDYNEVTLPQNAVDMETWAAGLDQISLLTDLTQLMQDYPFLAALFNSTEDDEGYDDWEGDEWGDENETQRMDPFVLPDDYTDDFMGLTGWNVDSEGYVDFEPLESEVLAAGKPSTGLQSIQLQDRLKQALFDYANIYFDDCSTYSSYWVGGYAPYNEVQSFYTEDYYFADTKNENNSLIIEFDAVTGDLVSVSLYYQYQDEAIRMINEILSVLEVDYAISASTLNEYTVAHNFAFAGFDGAEFGDNYYYISFHVSYTE